MLKQPYSSAKSADEWEFQGFTSPTTTPVPDEFFDLLAPRLAEAELRVVLYIIRRTFGWKKNSDNISLRQMVDGIQTKDGRVLDHGTGLSKPAVIRAVRSLAQRKVIIVTSRQSPDKGFEATTYSLNMRYSQAEDTPLSTKVTRGGKPSLPAHVNEDYQQQTVKQETAQQHVVGVVDALRKFGVSPGVADRLAKSYPQDIILQKLELVHWLLENNSPLVTKNPAGYLRRAIEEDYAAPRGYKPRAQRAVEEKEQRQAVLAGQEERVRSEAELAQAKEEAQRKLHQQYPPQQIPGTDLTTEAAWDQVLDHLRSQMSEANFNTWLKETSLVSLEDSNAVIAAASRFQTEWLISRFDPWIVKALSSVINHPISCEYLAVSELLSRNEPGGSKGNG